MNIWHLRQASNSLIMSTHCFSRFRRIFIPLLLIFLGTLSVHTQADQNAEALPALFAQLKNQTSSEASTELEHRIWAHWLEAPNRNAASLLSQVSRAMSVGRLDIALSLSNQLIDSAPEFAEAWNKRATIHFLLGQDADSVADIRETVKLEPNHFGAISGLGLIFMRSQNFPAALEAFEKVLQISPASISAKRSVERVRRELGREV